MKLEWSATDLAFRAEVRRFLDDNLTDELRAAGRLMTSVYADHERSMQWQKILAAKGWAAPAWPTEYGGCGWNTVQRYIFARECAAAGAPPLSPMGIRMCAPALFAFGTEEQKAFFLPRMLSGEHFWCQGYSEPGAGSDLAALGMTAAEDGDELVCNGVKVWTTHANHANWMFCLVRTARTARPQQGISFLLIDMTAAGIEVSPIISLTGEHIQNQIRFSDVRVPKRNLVGPMGEGWTVAKYLLEFERGGSAYAPGLMNRLEEIRRFAATVPGNTTARLLDDPSFVAKLMAAAVGITALDGYELHSMMAHAAGGSPGASASVMKVRGTELAQRLTELALEAAGYQGCGFQPQATLPGGPVHYPHADGPACGPIEAALAPLRYFNERAGTIYAGSNEIQRNILAKAALGL